METNTKKGVLTAGTAFGFAYWAALLVLLVKTGAFAKSAVEVPKIGFFEGVKNLIEGITTDSIGWGGYLFFFVFLMLIVAPLFGLVSVLKDSKKLTVPAIITSVLSLNFFAAILYIIGARPRFLDGRKTLLFVAGYIGAIVALFWLLLCTPLSGPVDGKAKFAVFTVIALVAVVLNIVGWRKNHSVVTFIAGIAYVLSVLGIPSAVLCFIGARPLLFLNGKKTMLFVAGFIGTIGALIMLLLCTPISGEIDKTTIMIFAVFTVITVSAVILNWIGWYKNNAKLTRIAAILYIFSIIGIPSAILCFIGFGKLKKEVQAG
ncbi:hypothetical protein FACS1894163_07440 [Spirochaetia bacterium]|nr:hypothetical protein FACS1894163_07440 [Spirochaetia bacterium]